MTGGYPVLLDAARLRVLVVGGGAVGGRRARGLVEAGAAPVVISPDAGDELRALAERARLVWHPRPYAPGDAAAGWHLVFCCAGDAAVNEAAAAEARAAGALVNRADDAAAGEVQVPSVLRRGEVVVAVSTGGASPALARGLRARLEAAVPEGLGASARRLREAREALRRRWPHDEARRRAAWAALVTPELLEAALDGRDDDVERRIAACLSQS